MILRGAHGARHVAVANAMRRVISSLHAQGRYKESEASARQTAEMLRGLGMERSPEMALVLNDLGLSRADQKDYVEAEALLKQVVALDSANFGPMHPDLATDLENLGYVYFEAQRYDLDLVVLAQTLAIRRAMLTDDNPAIGRTTFNIASVLRAKGDLAAALPMYREAQARLRRALEPTHPDVLVATSMVGRTLYELGRRTEAEAQLRAAIAVQGRDRGLPSWAYIRTASTLAALLIDERRYVEAEPLALRVLAMRDSTGDTLAKVARAQVVKLYEGWGKAERAADYRTGALSP